MTTKEEWEAYAKIDKRINLQDLLRMKYKLIAYSAYGPQLTGMCPNCYESYLADGFICPNCGYDSSYSVEEWRNLK